MTSVQDFLSDCIAFSIVIFFIVLGFIGVQNVLYTKLLNEIESNKSNIIFYLDGKEVSPDTVDIKQYQISYDNESNKVFLTERKIDVIRGMLR